LVFLLLLFRSQALRETKELKWLEIDETKAGPNGTKKKSVNKKEVVCPFCKLPGHKTRIASACLKHHEWLDASKADNNAGQAILTVDATTPHIHGPGADVPNTQLQFLLPKDPLASAHDAPNSSTSSVPDPTPAINTPAVPIRESHIPMTEAEGGVDSTAESAVSV
jgi:hypothetical protein